MTLREMVECGVINDLQNAGSEGVAFDDLYIANGGSFDMKEFQEILQGLVSQSIVGISFQTGPNLRGYQTYHLTWRERT